MGRHQWWLASARLGREGSLRGACAVAHRINVDKVVDIEEAIAETGKPAISQCWVDTNKGSIAAPQFRFRLVVHEACRKTPELTAAKLFSAMPPLGAFKPLASLFPTIRQSASGRPLRLAFYDVSRAQFYRKAKRRLYIQLPEEEALPGKCALLLHTMYGTSDASNM